jgi:thiol-disulfide isomerase/thioredoxin
MVLTPTVVRLARIYMKLLHLGLSRLSRGVCGMLASWVFGSAFAQPAAALPAVGSKFELAATTKDGGKYAMVQSVGKPALVMYWSTDCSTCKNKMPDVRAQLAKANGRFEVVLVNTDRSWSSAEAYEKILQTTNGNSTGSGGSAAKPVRIWRGEAGFSDSVGQAVPVANRAPLTLLIDKRGMVSSVMSGRFDDTVWTDLAKL